MESEKGVEFIFSRSYSILIISVPRNFLSGVVYHFLLFGMRIPLTISSPSKALFMGAV
jgi:hypothetical protein